jgi:hypothetical protein
VIPAQGKEKQSSLNRLFFDFRQNLTTPVHATGGAHVMCPAHLTAVRAFHEVKNSHGVMCAAAITP